MNENRSGSRRKNWKEKGYYIVLFLCVIAVGISGYVFVSTAVRQEGEKTLSTPLTAETLPPADGDKTAAVSAPEEDLEEETPPDPEELRRQAREEAVPPVKGELLQNFSVTALSYNDTTRDWRLHSAVDIAADGQTVSACMAGTVKEVFEDEYLGVTVAITHAGGYETRYSNLAELPTVSVGDTVKPGDAIGVVGDTAILETAQEPHLHFQVLVDGIPVDPTEFLAE